jgi:hypothetical protein
MDDFVPEDKTKVVLQYFTEARVKMIYECNNHPVLVAELEALGKVDWAETIGEIAAYCNVMMDGIYTNDDLEILYPQLTKRMTDTRLGHGSGIILSSDINQAKDKSKLS